MSIPANPVNAADTPPRDRDIDETAAELARKRMLPKPPGKQITWDEMQAYMQLLTPEMWGHVVLYLYRTHPRILRQLKNPDGPKYIDCVSQIINEEYMVEHHGGGKYSVSAVDTDAKFRGPGNKLFDCDFEINASKYEPKLNYEELDVNAKQNMAYIQLLQFKGILDSKGHPMTPQPQAAPGANPDVIKQVLEFVSTMTAAQQEAVRQKISPDEQALSKSLGEVVLQRIQQDDPSKQLVTLITVIKEVLAANKSTGGDSTQALEAFMKMNNEQNRFMMSMFEKLATRPDPPAPSQSNSQLEEFEKMFSLAERFAGLRGGRGTRSGWDIGLDYAREFGVPLMQTIANVMTLGRTPNGIPMPPAGTTAGAGATAPVAFDPYANPAAMQALARNAAASNPPPPQPANDLTVMLNQAGGLIVNALNNGTPGYHFADYLIGLMGVATHANIAAYGEPALLQALLSVPQIAVFGEPRLATFVNEFLNYQQFLDEEEVQSNQPLEQTAGMR